MSNLARCDAAVVPRTSCLPLPPSFSPTLVSLSFLFSFSLTPLSPVVTLFLLALWPATMLLIVTRLHLMARVTPTTTLPLATLAPPPRKNL